jgi:uncharacterized protein (TIGR03435 family)
LTLLLSAGAGAQSPDTPAFEVASVRVNRSGAPMQAYPTLQPSGRVFAINLPLRDLIRVAYGLDDNQLIISSPLADTQFDVEARAGTNATNEQAVLMLRTLLAERFVLKAHTETRQLPVYELVRMSATSLGPRIKRSGPECAPPTMPSALPPSPPPPPPPPPALAGTPLGPSRRWAECPTMIFSSGLAARAMDMSAFALVIERVVHRPVIDKTGLEGRFDIDMTFAPEFDGPEPTSPTGNAPAFTTALREQVGLRLESTRAPVNVLVVDTVQSPKEN